jgi:hypothetical protein
VKFPKLVIYLNDVTVGVISVANSEEGEYHLGCLCVIFKQEELCKIERFY